MPHIHYFEGNLYYSQFLITRINNLCITFPSKTNTQATLLAEIFLRDHKYKNWRKHLPKSRGLSVPGH